MGNADFIPVQVPEGSSLRFASKILEFSLTMVCPEFLFSVAVVVQSLSHVQLCDPMDCSTTDSSVFLLSPGVCSNSCPLSR